MLFWSRGAPKHKKWVFKTTFLLIKLKNLEKSKVRYAIFSHNFHIYICPWQIFMAKIIFTANVVNFANFTFRKDCSNKVSPKRGPNWFFHQKILLGTLKLTHLLCKNKTFISNSAGIQGDEKSGKNSFFSFSHEK